MLKFGGSSRMDRVITVGMPKSLPELQHTAAQNFGHSGCLRLYHQGTSLIYNAAQMNQIQDGDIIIVRKSEVNRPATTAGTPRMMSTHQADFTKHPYARPVTRDGCDRESVLTDLAKGVPLDGMSRYALDYIKHPINPPVPYKPPSALESQRAEPLGTTTYKREFPWREGSKRSAAVDDKALRESSLSSQSVGEKFRGASSYSIDYPRLEGMQARAELARLPAELRASSLSMGESGFSSETTYGKDFQKLGNGRQRSAKPKGDVARFGEPFLGTSEYRREYHELPLDPDRNMCVQLASEAFEGQCADELRMATAEALEAGFVVELELPPGVALDLDEAPMSRGSVKFNLDM